MRLKNAVRILIKITVRFRKKTSKKKLKNFQKNKDYLKKKVKSVGIFKERH